MKVVDSREYNEMKLEFIKAHDYDYKIETSQMNEDGRYYKEYIFSDGAFWYESMTPVWETITAEVHKVTVSVDVQFLRTEFWNSDDSKSCFLYEKY